MPDWILPPADILPRKEAVKELERIQIKEGGMIYTFNSKLSKMGEEKSTAVQVAAS